MGERRKGGKWIKPREENFDREQDAQQRMKGNAIGEGQGGSVAELASTAYASLKRQICGRERFKRTTK